MSIKSELEIQKIATDRFYLRVLQLERELEELRALSTHEVLCSCSSNLSDGKREW